MPAEVTPYLSYAGLANGDCGSVGYGNYVKTVDHTNGSEILYYLPHEDYI